jgi:hypothetical protein
MVISEGMNRPDRQAMIASLVWKMSLLTLDHYLIAIDYVCVARIFFLGNARQRGKERKGATTSAAHDAHYH